MDPLTIVRLLVQRTLAGIPELIANHGLHPETAARYSLIREWMILTNRKAPGIVSGYRSLQRQACLRENWIAGRQVNGSCPMPITSPAQLSRHTTTVAGVPASTAIDVSRNAPDLPYFAALWRGMPYGVAGSDFGDPNHFHINLPYPTPKPAWN